MVQQFQTVCSIFSLIAKLRQLPLGNACLYDWCLLFYVNMHLELVGNGFEQHSLAYT